MNLTPSQEKLRNQIVENVFKPIDEVTKWLESFEMIVTTTDELTTVKSPLHNATTGFHWDSLDYFTRGHELNFCFFAGVLYLPTTKLIEQKWKELNKKKK